MPHALLLSPDDQAVSAITAVLEEMSVTCERPLDGPSAAKKLNSQSFDLVLVDCENLPAAKLIFDVCRRSQTGTNPVPIAIVDGRAGLPTAFRLGAELILTKPVAKDQARTTIRTAVSRVRKDETARTIQPFESTAAEITIPEKHAQAAAAGAAISSPSVVAETASPAAPAESMVAKMSSAAEELATAPASRKLHAVSSNETVPPLAIPETAMFKPAPKAAPAKASDDPILADLESDSPTPVFTSYVQPKKKVSGALVALLVLVLAGGGLYAAWMYQPGLREMAQPQIDRLMALIGRPSADQTAAAPRAAATPLPAKGPAPQTATTTALLSSDAAATPAAASTLSPTPAATDTASSLVAPTATSIPVPAASKSEAPIESKKNVAAAVPSDTELPGEKTAVILSSQGAEKRLLRHPQPTYPAEARKAGIEGTVVLKTVVSDGGTVEGVRLVEGNPTLAAAAIGAVKQWHYRPYVRDGRAQPFQTIVLVEFQRP